jgi:hypothetical protein
MKRRIYTVLACFGLLVFSGCSSFQREWRMWAPLGTIAGKTTPPPPAQSPFDGRWQGRWTSERHTKLFSNRAASGELRCVFTRIDPYRYRANFHAQWMIFRSEYLAELHGYPQRGKFRLRGVIPVSPIFGGDYRYDGTVTPNRFTLRYDSKYDAGTLEMRRVR